MSRGEIETHVIWRYLDLAKFVHLIATKSLHFTRIDRLNKMDKFEGSYPLKNLKDWQHKYPEVGDFGYWRKFACVSCWCESDHESAAMWKLYTKNNQGIAICSTEEKLKRSLKCDFIQFQKIKYIDFLKDKADIATPYEVFLYKRIEFKHEREFRAFQFKVPENDGFEDGFPRFGSVEKQDGFPENGINVRVDLQLLIEKIVLSPYSKKWYRDVLKDILSRYNLPNLTVDDSALRADPVYPKQ